MYNTKTTIISAAIAAMLPTMAQADVIISEYVEGSSNNKAIELYNSGDSAVDLSTYSLVRYKDGDTEASDSVTLEGEIAAGAVKVIHHSSAVLGLDESVDAMTGSLVFNGGDAVGLLNGDVVVDVVGDVPTESGWGQDTTFARNTDALTASAAFVASQWTALDKDTFSGLGTVSNEGDTPDPIEVEPFVCADHTLTPIYTVQGTGTTSPLIDEDTFESASEVTVKGIVTARGESLFKGFYLQDVEGDGVAETSDGIFVYLGEEAPASIQPGVEVCVQGLVKEYYDLTQIDIKDEQKMEVGAQGETLTATSFYVNEGDSLQAALERFEGMKIKLEATNELLVSRSFSYDYDASRNNMMLSHKSPLMKPTQVYAPLSEEAIALAEANRLNQLFIESDYKAGSGVVPYFNEFNAETGYIRIGDTIADLEGMVSYSYGQYRLVVTNTLEETNFIHNNDRLDTPEAASLGDIRVASFNVLNYFTHAIEGDANPSGSNRGAESEADMVLQRTKIVNAIIAMNADIVGLMEIENNGYGEKSAIQNLLTALNSGLEKEQAYQFIEITDADKYDGQYLGSDAIAVGLLYRPSTVTPVGDAFVIETPEQHAPDTIIARIKDGQAEANPAYDKYQRHSLAQTFSINDESLTVVVNHLKSKGSACLEDWIEGVESSDPADLQGRCNEFRVSAATVLGDALSTVEGDILVIGDMNAYGLEDPIRVLTDYDAETSDSAIYTASHTTLAGEVFDTEAREIKQGYGFINLNTEAHGAATYSYNYSGELGNLDHALGNTSVAERVVAIEDWHINSVESNMFEYSSKYTGDLVKSDNAFSASDHDPVIIALDYTEEEPEVEPEIDTGSKSSSDGGSLGFLGLGLLSLLGLSRRKR
ncbi:extracellular exonuclease ExeM [Shewanella surugensis]|uniref:Extracellular exonuclease ExeM n=1 Tax=Shewanella surugensis TaxID=212020 RepID=A0ABT0L9N9_9GAMM|nr:extracellular exonuclease ExeM [Shewanella surugensis]MCL1124075.1 extracellular exonuclease ExeM [Shewanella surugensis]